MSETGSAIEVRDLRKTFVIPEREAGLTASLRSLVRRKTRQVQAVDGVSFDLAPGEVVGFLGPNGAGKTTTIKMLSGLLYPTSGEGRVLGFVPERREKAFLRQITLVMGNRNQLQWDIPALDSFELHRAIYRIPRPEFVRMRDEFIELLEVGSLVKKPVRNLSLGERMKMEIIGALLHTPRVLFLDEPTIGLDVTMQARIRTFIAEYNRRYGATVLLTSHYMADVEALCKRVIVIHHGQILFDGSLEHPDPRFSAYKTIGVRFEVRRAFDLDATARSPGAKPTVIMLRVAKERHRPRHGPLAGRSAGHRSHGGGAAHRRRDQECVRARAAGMSAYLDFYWTSMKLAIAVQLQYRVSNYFYMIGMVAEPVIYLVVWSTIARTHGGSSGGLHGRTVCRLLHRLDPRPQYEYRLYPVWLGVPDPRRPVLGPPAEAAPSDPLRSGLLRRLEIRRHPPLAPDRRDLTLIFHPTISPPRSTFVVFAVAIWGGYLIRSMLLWVLGLVTFWTTRVGAIFQLYFAAELVLSGRLVPLSLLPAWAQTLSNFLPFQWTFGFPIEALVGNLSTTTLLTRGSPCRHSGSPSAVGWSPCCGASACATTRRWGSERGQSTARRLDLLPHRRHERAAVPGQLLPGAVAGGRRARHRAHRPLADLRHTSTLDGWTPAELLIVMGVFTLMGSLIRPPFSPIWSAWPTTFSREPSTTPSPSRKTPSSS